jgi:hypothetical protein
MISNLLPFNHILRIFEYGILTPIKKLTAMKSKIFISLLALAFAISLNAQDIISDFEGAGGATISYAGLDTAMVIVNPVPGGDNTSDSVLLYDRGINTTGSEGMWNKIVYFIPDAALNTADYDNFSFKGYVNVSGEFFVRLWNDGGMVSGDGNWATPQQCVAGEWITFTYALAGMGNTDVDSLSLEFGDWTTPTDSAKSTAGDGYLVYIDDLMFDYQALDTNANYPAVYTLVQVVDGDIEIDGDVDFAWDDVTAVDSVNNVAIDVHGTGVDCGATFKACWDSEAVYIWIDVQDDDANAYAATATQPWNNDGIEIFTDGGAFNYNTGRVSAQQIQHRINLGYNDNTGNWSLGGDTLTWAEVPVQGGVYSFEVAIPFFVFYRPYQADDAATINTIPTLAVGGELLGIEISILDAEAIDIRDGLLNWSNNSGNDISYTQSRYYGRFILGITCKKSSNCGGWGIIDKMGLNIKIYPNPSKDFITVEMINLASIEVYTIDGRKMLHQDAENGSAKVDVSNLNSGLYLLRAYNKDNMYTTAKFQKE